MANQNIMDFYQQAYTVDFARKFQFRIITLGDIDLGDERLVYLTTANLPGRAITNVPTPFMGLVFNVPGTATYPGSNAWSVQFRCDQDYDIRMALETSSLSIFNENTSTGKYNTPSPGTNIVIELQDKDLTPISTYTLVGCYLQTIGEVAYDLTDSGTVVTLPTTLAYQYWTNGLTAAVQSNGLLTGAVQL